MPGVLEIDALPLDPVFMARAAELSRVRAELATVRAGAPLSVLTVSGAAGSGRTRFLEAAQVLARAEGAVSLAVACALGGDRPFGPFIRLFQAWLPTVRVAAAEAPPEQRAALARLVPALEAPPSVADLEPREAQVVTQAAISYILRILAGPGALLTLDDWDMADPASVAALAYTRRNAGDMPLLIVTTAREGGDMTLPPLTMSEVAALTVGMLGGGDLPEGFPEALQRWSAGRPGAVRHIVAHLLRSGSLVRHGDAWAALEGLTVGNLAPAFLAEALTPIATLEAPARALVELIAVLDDQADMASLTALAGLDATTLDTALNMLVARDIAVRQDAQVIFTSVAWRQAAYRLASEGRRLWLHALAALYLEGLISATEHDVPDLHIALARHLVASRQVKKALPAALTAAELAMARGEVEAAHSLLCDALAAEGPHAAEPDVLAGKRCDALVQLAAIERWRGDFEAMGRVLDQAELLADTLPDGASRLRLLVLRAAYFNQLMTPAALTASIGNLGKALALPVVDPLWQARGRYFLGQAYFYLGQPTAAAFAFEAAADAAERDRLPFWRAKSLAFLGYLAAKGAGPAREQGFARLSEAATLQAGLGDRYGRCFTLALQGDALLGALRLHEAEEVLTAQLAIVEELGIGEDRLTCLTNLALTFALQGRYRKAVETCAAARPLALANGQTVALLALAVEGYARVALGELAAGARCLEEAGQPGRGGYMWLHALPFVVEGWRWLGRFDEVVRLVTETREAQGAITDPELFAQLAALEGEARLNLGTGGVSPPCVTGEPALSKLYALRLATRLALADNRLAQAEAAADAMRALAEAGGAAGLAAEARGLRGHVALAAGSPDALRVFCSLSRFAER